MGEREYKIKVWSYSILIPIFIIVAITVSLLKGRPDIAIVIGLGVASIGLDAISTLTEEERIPYVVTLTNRVVLVQVLTVLGGIYVISSGQPLKAYAGLVYVFLVVGLVMLLFGQGYITRQKRNLTRNHLDEIIYNLEIKGPNISKELLRKISMELIDEDFVERSFGNVISANYRERQREILAELMTAITEGASIEASQFLVPNRKGHVFHKLYIALGILLLLLITIFIVMLIFSLPELRLDQAANNTPRP